MSQRLSPLSICFCFCLYIKRRTGTGSRRTPAVTEKLPSSTGRRLNKRRTEPTHVRRGALPAFLPLVAFPRGTTLCTSPMSSSFGQVWSDAVARTQRRPSQGLPAPTRSKAAPPFSPATAPQGQRFPQQYTVPTPINGHHAAGLAAVTKAAKTAAGSRGAVGAGGSGSGNGAGNSGGGAYGAHRDRERPTPVGATVAAGVPLSSHASYDPELPPAGLPTLHQSSSGSEDEGFSNGINDAEYERTLRKLQRLSSAQLGSRASRGAGIAAAAAGAKAAAPASPSLFSSSSSSLSPSLPPRTPNHQRVRPALSVTPPVSRASTAAAAAAAATFVSPSSAPPPLPNRRTAVAVASPSRPVRRPQSLPLSALARAKVFKRHEGDDGRAYFCDPRLESTLVRYR